MTRERATYLLDRYHADLCTPEERAEFVLLLHHPKFKSLRNELLDSRWPKEGDTDVQEVTPAVYERILATIKSTPRASSVRRFRLWFPFAAAIIAMTLVGIWLFVGNQADQCQSQLGNVDDVQPGGNRATLTLADGREIELSDEQSGIVIGTGISYLDGTSIIDNGETPERSTSIIDYQISTPKGGTYQVTLPDGTHVWLNAGTILRYPSKFDADQRVVELSGEAYFDVTQIESKHAKNKKVPFLVRTNSQTIEVLGTQFNLSAYKEDGDVKTTLVEGSVRVASPTDEHLPVVLEPGQQSIYAGGKVAVATIDVEPFIAWKDGYFDFLYTPFPEMIAQIARWYDIKLIYKGEVPNETFSGKMSRDVTLQYVLKFVEGSGIKVTLDNGQLIIGE